tara:strand:+ start:883 stop:1194 length:312 start_codon:yes stop_codon:yes gene_type:complete
MTTEVDIDSQLKYNNCTTKVFEFLIFALNASGIALISYAFYLMFALFWWKMTNTKNEFKMELTVVNLMIGFMFLCICSGIILLIIILISKIYNKYYSKSTSPV